MLVPAFDGLEPLLIIEQFAVGRTHRVNTSTRDKVGLIVPAKLRDAVERIVRQPPLEQCDQRRIVGA